MRALIFLMFIGSIHTTLSAAENLNERPCAADVEKFCPGKEGAQRMRCMKKNEKDLSSECRNFRDQLMQSAKEVRAACKDDRKKFCGDKKRKEVMQCMQDNFKNLNDLCRGEIAKFRK